MAPSKLKSEEGEYFMGIFPITTKFTSTAYQLINIF